MAIVAVPAVELALMAIDESVPWSPDSDVFRATDTGIVTVLESASDSLAVTVTESPSVTVVGAAESVTVGTYGLPVVDAQLLVANGFNRT